MFTRDQAYIKIRSLILLFLVVIIAIKATGTKIITKKWNQSVLCIVQMIREYGKE